MLSKRKYKRDIRRLILVVDDEIVNRELLGHMLSRDYDVLYAENGREALERVRENRELLSMILLDLLMPEMDGLTMLKCLREDVSLRHIPVIVLTSEKEAEVTSLRLGASDFLSKPLDRPEVILTRIRRAIELSEETHIIEVAERDSLTRLYNLDFFYEYANELDRHHPNWDMDAIVINVNHFRLLNELYGRDLGDQVLQTVAEGIRELLTTVEGIAGRAEADNFYLYLRHLEDYEAALHAIGDRLRARFQKISIWLRMGIFLSAHEKATPEGRFEKALSACSTLRGKFNVYIAYYDRRLHEAELLAEELVNGMEHALEEGQFRVYYQAQYGIRESEPQLAGAEALVRWDHPEKGFLRPGMFIPLLESKGLIQKLDRFVFRSVAAQIRAWKNEFGYALPVSVNVSRMDIYETDLCDFFTALMREYGLEEGDMILEVTESAYTEDSRQLVQTVEQLRERGFRIEMDDFGSGYSSLNMITSLPIDCLKLDLGFLRRTPDEDKRKAILRLMLDIAAHLKVPVIAEGVETEEQYSLLKTLGCDMIQGYYFARPLPADEFSQLLKENK